MGILIGVWITQIPAVKQLDHLSDGQLGIALFAIPLGTLAVLPVTSIVIDRVGSRRILPVACLLAGLLLVGAGLSINLFTLFAALFLFGTSLCFLNIAMNDQGIKVERRYERSIMASFHGSYSCGALLGSAIGGFLAQAGNSPIAIFIYAGIPLGFTGLLVSRGMVSNETALGRLPDENPNIPQSVSHRDNSPDLGIPPVYQQVPSRRKFMILSLLALLGALAEGAMADWANVYLRDDLNAIPVVASAGFAVFSVSILAGRLVGDRISDRIGPKKLIRLSGMVAGLGLAGGLISHRIFGALAGFAAMGLGLSCIVPLVMSAIGRTREDRFGASISRITGISTIGNLTGPVLIGGIATISGLGIALGIPAIIAVATVFLAGSVAQRVLSRAPT